MKVIYPGSFDPITYGHIDIINRSKEIFGEVVVAVLVNKSKTGLFTIEERIELIREVLDKDIEVDYFEGLLVDYAKTKGCRTIVRGLRSSSDYASEANLAMANKNYKDGIETLFLQSSNKYNFISSTLAKEVAVFNGDLTLFVPKVVENAMKDKYKNNRR